jgi:hypothetical protein
MMQYDMLVKLWAQATNKPASSVTGFGKQYSYLDSLQKNDNPAFKQHLLYKLHRLEHALFTWQQVMQQ